MNCVLYARVSTAEQAEKELSIPAQLQAMRDYAAARQWTVVEEFLEPGVSAKTAERPALQALLRRVRSGEPKISVVLVHKIDRLARNVFDHATIKALLKQHDVRLASVVENVDDTVSGQLVENIMASIAQFYSANLSDEVKKGMHQKVIQGGWPHRPPRGYVVVRTPGKPAGAVALHSKDGPLMKRAFELYATGWYSVQTLANRLAKEGLLDSHGNPIAHGHLSRLLANSFYAGSVRWHGMEYPGTQPALISRELFQIVQETMRQRFGNPGPRGSVIAGFPLRGLAICAGCRGRMTGERHDKWSYYRCSRQTFRRELCSARMCNVERAHEGVNRICRQITIDRDVAEQISKAAETVIRRRVEEYASRRENIKQDSAALAQTEMRLAEAFAAGDMAPGSYTMRVNELRRKRDAVGELEARPPLNAQVVAESVGRTLQLATSLWDVYEPMNERRRASLLKAVFGTIILDHGGVAGFTLKPPFDALVKSDASQPPEQLADVIVDTAV